MKGSLALLLTLIFHNFNTYEDCIEALCHSKFFSTKAGIILIVLNSVFQQFLFISDSASKYTAFFLWYLH